MPACFRALFYRIRLMRRLLNTMLDLWVANKKRWHRCGGALEVDYSHSEPIG